MKNLLCNQNKTIYETLKQIDENTQGVIFIVNDNEIFLGTVTDGDIRRAILNRLSIDLPITELLKSKKKSVSALIGTDQETLLSLINETIKIIPLLDESGKVIDYFQYKASFHAPIAATHLNGNELSYVIECISSNWISSQGKFVKEFEQNFAGFIGTKYGVSAMNGTVALHLALSALDIGPGDEVILPDLTFAATINAVLYTGATPVIVDVEADSWCIDPVAIRRAISPKTKAIIPVHIYGQPCNMDAITEIADANNLFIIEDCAEAVGAEYKNKKVGSFSKISCFSFYGNKIITTGEGGMCMTDDPKLDEKMRTLRDHGMSREKRYWHDQIGFNYRLTNLQAAIGVAQLERIDEIIKNRDSVRKLYETDLQEKIEFTPQKKLADRKSVVWLVCFLFSSEKISVEEFVDKAGKEGIDVRPFFFPLSIMPIYRKYAKEENVIAIDLSKKGISLPTLTALDKDGYVKIINKIKEVLR